VCRIDSFRYRICLRTFAPADSVAVLGTADAHTLPPSPGCGWLKVDSDTQQRFEGAVVSIAGGGRHAPPPTPHILPFEPVRPAGAWHTTPVPVEVGRAGESPCPTRQAPGHGCGAVGTDLDAVVTALSGPDVPGRRARRVWLPPLAASITLGALLAEAPRPASDGWRRGTQGWLRVPVGVVDKPLQQAQAPLVLDFTGATGHLVIVGAPRSGKSTLLATIVAAFALTHAADAVQFYGIDLGGGLLHQLASLPQVGAVCGRHDRDEARHLVRELRALVATRECGPGPRDGGRGEVLLVVDNWARLRQELGELEPEIEALAAGGLHHGVHLIIAANRWADLRLGLRDNLGGRLELHLNDPLESAVGRAAAAALPGDVPGCGLTATGLRFQAALPLVDEPAGDVSGEGRLGAAAAELARRAVRSRDGIVAPPLRMLPTVVHPADLRHADLRHADLRHADLRHADLPALGAVPLGLHEDRLAPVWLDLLSGPPHFLVLGDAGCGKTSVLRCLATGLGTRSQEEIRLVVVDYRHDLSDLAKLPHCGAHVVSPAMAVEAVAHLRRACEQRLAWCGGLPRLGLMGPRHVLLVDDYHLVAGASNPLEPLLDLLAHGDAVGLHVVLTCAAVGAARAAFDPFLRRLHELGSPGLLMSGDPRQGPLLGGHAAVPLPPGRGLLVPRQGASGLVQVAWTPAPVVTETLRSHPP
jgi:S-DNA-T family DNA segregation ATPase FtsK/SpoIIIE